MDLFGFKLHNNIPCMYTESTDLLILSDLHLGLEGSMTSNGSYIPKVQLDDTAEKIEEARKHFGANRLLINGDLKNEFHRNSYSEKEEIEKLMKMLSKRLNEIIIVKGNHDTFIEQITDFPNVKIKEEYLENKVLYSHGHKKIDLSKEFETLVIGHEHPALNLRDEIGTKEKIDCYLHGSINKKQNIIVLPAFAGLSKGTGINELPKSKLLSPVLRNKVEVLKLEAIGITEETGLMEFSTLENINSAIKNLS